MKDIRFVLGECTKSNVKYYFQYNNKVYLIIEKTPTSEKILDKITNIRFAYDKWKTIKADSDEKVNKQAHEEADEEKQPKDYSYTTIVFEYESDPLTKNVRERLPKEKVKIERITLDKTDDKSERRKNTKRNDFEKKNKEKHFSEYPSSEKKNFKKNNPRYDKNNSYRRTEYKGDRAKNNQGEK